MKPVLPEFLNRPLPVAEQQRSLKMLEAMLSLPTAPFVEGHVLAFVARFAEKSGLCCRQDRYGNLLLTRTRRLPARSVVFVAHCDHPGFVARRMVGKGRLLADWHGGVEKEYFVGSRVRFHAELGKGIAGKVRKIVTTDQEGAHQRVRTVEIDTASEVPPGSPGTWDVPLYQMKGRTIHAARIDDIAGLTAALAGFDLLGRRGVRHRAAILVTRAEEAGLIGATGAAFSGTLPAEAAVLSIECSLSQVDSPQQAGPIVRVGDRTSLFDPDLGDWLSRIAAGMADRDPTFRWQRKLMPGGTCEASVFRAAGYRAAGLCIPLRNYHNRDTTRGRIEAEIIDRDDWLGLIRLIAAAAASAPRASSTRSLARRFRQLLTTYKPLLRDPLQEP